MKRLLTRITARNAPPRMKNVRSTPTEPIKAFATGGTITELKPYAAVAIPPASPRLSGKNFTQLLIVAP